MGFLSGLRKIRPPAILVVVIIIAAFAALGSVIKPTGPSVDACTVLPAKALNKALAMHIRGLHGRDTGDQTCDYGTRSSKWTMFTLQVSIAGKSDKSVRSFKTMIDRMRSSRQPGIGRSTYVYPTGFKGAYKRLQAVSFYVTASARHKTTSLWYQVSVNWVRYAVMLVTPGHLSDNKLQKIVYAINNGL